MKTILNNTALVAGLLFAAQFAAQRAHAQQIPIDAGSVARPIVGETDAYRASRGVPRSSRTWR